MTIVTVPPQWLSPDATTLQKAANVAIKAALYEQEVAATVKEMVLDFLSRATEIQCNQVRPCKKEWRDNTGRVERLYADYTEVTIKLRVPSKTK